MDLITDKDDPRLDSMFDGVNPCQSDADSMALLCVSLRSALSELSGIRERMTREKVARALYYSYGFEREKYPWEHLGQPLKDVYLEPADAVLALLEGRKG
jgi:hypothetical protein